MKSKKSHSKKSIFDLPVPKDSSISSSLSSLRDVTSDTSIFNIDYAERVA